MNMITLFSFIQNLLDSGIEKGIGFEIFAMIACVLVVMRVFKSYFVDVVQRHGQLFHAVVTMHHDGSPFSLANRLPIFPGNINGICLASISIEEGFMANVQLVNDLFGGMVKTVFRIVIEDHFLFFIS